MAGKGSAPGERRGGRKKGSLNKIDVKLKERALRMAKAGTSPLDFMLAVMRDKSQPMELRLHAAGKAAPYVHRALKAVEHTGEGGGPMRIEIGWMGAE